MLSVCFVSCEKQVRAGALPSFVIPDSGSFTRSAFALFSEKAGPFTILMWAYLTVRFLQHNNWRGQRGFSYISEGRLWEYCLCCDCEAFTIFLSSPVRSNELWSRGQWPDLLKFVHRLHYEKWIASFTTSAYMKRYIVVRHWAFNDRSMSSLQTFTESSVWFGKVMFFIPVSSLGGLRIELACTEHLIIYYLAIACETHSGFSYKCLENCYAANL